jgi:hypothetical protein
MSDAPAAPAVSADASLVDMSDPAAHARATGIPWVVVDADRPVEEAAKAAGFGAGFRQACSPLPSVVSDGHIEPLCNPWSTGNEVGLFLAEREPVISVCFDLPSGAYTMPFICENGDETVGEFTKRVVCMHFTSAMGTAYIDRNTLADESTKMSDCHGFLRIKVSD